MVEKAAVLELEAATRERLAKTCCNAILLAIVVMYAAMLCVENVECKVGERMNVGVGNAIRNYAQKEVAAGSWRHCPAF